MKIVDVMFVAVIAVLANCAGSGIARAQRVDVFIAQSGGRLATGNAYCESDNTCSTGQWSLGRRVFPGEFDGDFAVDIRIRRFPIRPRFRQAAGIAGEHRFGVGLPADDHRSAEGQLVLLERPRFGWTARFYAGRRSIRPLPGASYTLGLYGKSGPAITVNGSPVLVPGGVIDDTDDDGHIHEHRYYELLDNDANGSTAPADGIYLFAMQLRMSGLLSSKPIYMVFGTLNSFVDALDAAAVPWVEARVNTLIGLPGDYNRNGTVDAADSVVWRDTMGSTMQLAADGDFNGSVDAGDYGVWRANFGATMAGSGAAAAASAAAVPEASAFELMLITLCCVAFPRCFFRNRAANWGKW